MEIAFTRIPNLKYLSKVHNLLELTLLHTKMNSLVGLEAAGHSLSRLTVISGCCFDTAQQLSCIEPVVLKMTELQYLHLGENQICKIENLENCHKLQCLYLYNNSIKKIENLQNCMMLEEIYLGSNKIRKVENIGNILCNLHTLNLSANKIEYFEDINEICQMPKLKKLNF